MEVEYFVNEKYLNTDYSEENLPKGEYEKCTFKNCNFSNSKLSEINFIECLFIQCDLSLANVTGTAFRDVKFSSCKILGLHFENCNHLLFSVGFEACQLNLSCFYLLNMKNTFFKNSSIQEVDFTESILTGSNFDNCDLSGATFDHSNLENTDFHTAVNYRIDPEINRIKSARFSIPEVVGLLSKYDIKVEL